MNWVDFVIILILIFFLIEGLGKPLIAELLDLLSFLLSFFLSLKFYFLPAKQLETLFLLPHSLANVLGFILIWYVVETALYIIVRRLKLGYLFPSLTFLEGILSLLPALFKGLIFTAIILVLVITFPIQPKVKKDVQNSQIGPLILSRAYQLEAPFKNIFGDSAFSTLTFLTIRPQANEVVSLGFTNGDFIFDENLEFAMIEKVNLEREKVGLSPLVFDIKLREIARNHSADMFRRGYFAHRSPEGKDVSDRAQELNISFLVIGENLAYAPILELAHQGLMNSPGHRANILGAGYHKIGIGIASSNQYGLMITQVFKD